METAKRYLSNRILKINVGFLLVEGPGNSHESTLDVPSPVRISEDLILNYIYGNLRLTRAKEGVLVQGRLVTGVDDQCDRCLDPVENDVVIGLEELFAYLKPNGSEFIVESTGILDLGPLVRAEVVLNTSGRILCSADCKGLCQECGANLNREICGCEQDKLDPRLAVLRTLLNSG